jgi:hypothetical protein
MKGRLSPFKTIGLVVKKDHLRVAKVFRATVPFTAPRLDKGSQDLEWVIWSREEIHGAIGWLGRENKISVDVRRECEEESQGSSLRQ